MVRLDIERLSVPLSRRAMPGKIAKGYSGCLYDFRMDFCDLIVGMEQTGINPRPVVGAIIVVSGLAVSFLLWLLYVHHASAVFAGRWRFWPALKTLLTVF